MTTENNKTSETKDSKPSTEIVAASANADESATKTTNADKQAKKNSDKKTDQKQASKIKVQKQRQSISYLALLALLLALGVATFSGYGFWLLQSQMELSKTLANKQEKDSEQISALAKQLTSTESALKIEINKREQTAAELKELNKSFMSVASQLGRTTIAWRLAEIEYLLTIANHRLTLAQDTATAIAIFETADQRIRAIGDPALVKIRKAITDELAALRSLPNPDIEGMVLSVGSLLAEVDHLPLVDTERVAVATGQQEKKTISSWREVPAAVWEDIKSLVVVRRHQQPIEPLLPPDEAWFLQQNLRLQLEQARLALLRRDTALLRQSLNEANSWINTFFDQESSAVQSTVTTLNSLSKVELQPSIPDVSGSLRALRSLLAEHGMEIGNTKQGSPVTTSVTEDNSDASAAVVKKAVDNKPAQAKPKRDETNLGEENSGEKKSGELKQ